jgi:hypothetical protein
VSWHVRIPSHHCYGFDSRSFPAWPVCHSWLLHLATRLYLHPNDPCYGTRIPTTDALITVALPSTFLYTILTLVGLTVTWPGSGSAIGLLFAFCLFDSCMAFRLEDTILALIRPTSCTIRLYLSFAFVFRAIIIPMVTDCYGRQTNPGCWTTLQLYYCYWRN